jgi:hypothetical protein
MISINKYKYISVIWLPVLALVLAVAVAFGMNASAAPPSSPENCPPVRFTDVCPGDTFYTYIMSLSDMGVVSGYADGTFRPNNNVTRGQMMKIVVAATGLNGTLPATPTFADVPDTHTFYTWIEIGVAHGVVSGYNCGGPFEACDPQSRPYFRPGANVTRGQLSKMITIAKGWEPLVPSTPTFNDVPADNPFFGYIERVSANGVVAGYDCGRPSEPCPGRYFRPVNDSTRGQASKMVWLAISGPVPTPVNTAVPTIQSTPEATATHIAGQPCPVFPANNIWNRNISALPTHALSDNYINSIGLTSQVHADFGSGLWEGAPIGIPFVRVGQGQPLVDIFFTEYGEESDPGPYPVPTNAPIEGGPDSSGDRHVLVVDDSSCILYEMYHAYPRANSDWEAGCGAVFPLTSNQLREVSFTSADAAGLPIYPGLVRYDEVASGAITHALRFTAPSTQRAYLWPARHFASSSTDPNLPPMGLRVRLKAAVNISTYPPEVRVILQALKDYGMFLADNGSPWYISGAPDERWDNDMLHLMDVLQGSDFEAVDESSLMIDPNSGQSR